MANSGTGTGTGELTVYELSLIEEINSYSDQSSIYSLFSDYLQPFTDYKTETRSTKKLINQKFFQFLRKALNEFPTAIRKPRTSQNFPSKLFDTYNLCLKSMEIMVPGITNYRRRSLLMSCYKYWGRYNEAKDECEIIFNGVRSLYGKENTNTIPHHSRSLIPNTVISFIKLVKKVESLDENDFHKAITMVEYYHYRVSRDESDEDARLRLQSEVVKQLDKCTLFLFNNLHQTSGHDLFAEFCSLTFSEHANLSLNDDMRKFHHMIYTLILNNNNFLFKLLGNMCLKCEVEWDMVTPDSLDTSLKVLHKLKKENVLNFELCILIEAQIRSKLLETLFTKHENYWNLIAKARDSRENGGLDDCINFLDNGISIMRDNKSKDEANGPFCSLLGQALCLRVLCKQEAEPHLQLSIDDVQEALGLWMSEEHLKFAKENHMVSQYTFNLLYHICDLLSLKGYMEHHLVLYEMMINFSQMKNNNLKKCLAMFWESRSLNHAGCPSPVSDEFMKAFSKHSRKSDSMKYWESCVKISKLAFGSTISSSVSYNEDQAIKSIEEIKMAAFDSEKKVPLSRSQFLLAHLYYELSDRMAARGSMIEALFYACEALKFRLDLLKRSFDYSTKKENGSDVGLKLTGLYMHPVVASTMWSCHFENFILTPYSVLRCYLESMLQVGTIHEILGNVKDAERTLLEGKRLSFSQCLPIFKVSFSCALGKIYRKKKLLRKCEEELNSALSILNDKHSLISCLKCRLVTKVTVYQEIGDFYTNSADFTNPIDKEAHKYLEKAEKFYSSGLNTYRGWDNSVSNSEKGTEKSSGNDNDACTCWYCVPCMASKSVRSVTDMNWEGTRRHLLLRLLIGLGKCSMVCKETEKAGKVFLESMPLLLCRSTVYPLDQPDLFTNLFEFIKKSHATIYFNRTELAPLIYIISRLSLKNSSAEGSRISSGTMLISIPLLVDGLKLAFIYSREVPELFQQISRLLSLLYTLSPLQKEFSVLSSSSDALSARQWAAFFHQASIGSYIYPSFSRLQIGNTAQGASLLSSSTSITSLRTAPESVKELEGFVAEFFKSLPLTTVVCLSIFEDGYGTLLGQLYTNASSTRAWIMLSRFSSDGAPVVVVLSVDSVLSENSDAMKDSNEGPCKSSGQSWDCPWGHSIVDTIAPLFKKFVREIEFCSQTDASKEAKYLLSNRLVQLNGWIQGLLRDIEKNWLGKWKTLFLEELMDKKEEYFSDILKEGCYIGKKQFDMVRDDSHKRKKCNEQASKKRKEDEDPRNEKSIILVLDLEIQMLPWESLPFLNNQEIYRMPSVSSIFYAFERYCDTHNPMIDPFDTYYLINPSGISQQMEDEFAAWFKELKFEGVCGFPPPKATELKTALEKHDLFVYGDHGDGLVFFGNEIDKVDRCAAALLVGCESGLLKYEGSYSPSGAPLTYLFGHSRIIVGTLWSINLYFFSFVKFLLGRWMEERNKGSKSTRKAAWFMRQAGNACILTSSSGAAPICYGLPTSLRVKEVSESPGC